MPYLPNKSSALGFTLIELIVTLVLIAILAVIAAPRFLNLNSDARTARIKGIAASIQSAIELSLGKAAIAGVDTQGEAHIDLNGDGVVESIGFRYGQPIVVGSIALDEITDIDMCVADEAPLNQTTCNEQVYLIGRFNAEGIRVHYTLTDSSADEKARCMVDIANAVADRNNGVLLPTTVSYSVDGC